MSDDEQARELKQLIGAMNDGNLDLLRQWASNAPKNWQQLYAAWLQSSNKSVLTWDVLHECIELSNDNVLSVPVVLLSTLHAFCASFDTLKPRWIESLNEKDAHALIERAVAWRLSADHGDAYSMQVLHTGALMHLSIGCRQGRIWHEYSELYKYPMEASHAMQCAEAARCTDPRIYNAAWTYQQHQTTRFGWKKQMLARHQLHNVEQLSNTPFVACEYIIEQHAQHDNQESYAQIIARSQFAKLKEVDAWMLTQLAQPSGTWNTAGCPNPDDRCVQAWWYSLQMGADDAALLYTLSHPVAAPLATLSLPEDIFTMG